MSDVNPSEPVVEPTAPPVEPVTEPVKTIADGGDGDDLPVSPQSVWPDDWREQFAGKDEAALKQLKRYKDPGTVFKAHQALRTKMDSGEYMRSKPDTDDEDVLKAWRAEVGVPEKPEDYLDDIEIAEDDREHVNKYLERMHAAGASKAHVQDGLQWYNELQNSYAEERAELDRGFRKESEDTLRSEWGPEYRPNLNGMHGLIDQYAPEGFKEKLFSARLADGTPLGDDPDALRFLVGLAREINPFGTVTPKEGETQMQSIEEEIAILEKEMADTKDKNSDYYHNEAKQQRYRDLIDIRDNARKRA